MSQFVLNDFSGWISQENFAWWTGQVGYLENINIDERKYMKLEQAFSSASVIWSFNEVINQMVETPNGVIQIWPTKTFLGTGDVSATVSWWDRVEFFWDATTGQYNIILQATNIYKTNNIISSATSVAHWVTWTVTASCIDNKYVLFAKSNVIYRCDVSLATPTAPAIEIDTIPYGSKIQYMYVHNDVLYVVVRKYLDTDIWTCQFDTTTNKFALSYKEPIPWVRCLSAIWDRWSIYLVSSTTIYQFNWGQVQELRKYGYWSSLSEVIIGTPILHFSNNILYVASWNTIYRFGSRTPWRKWYMRTSSFTDNIVWITENYIHALSWSSNRLYSYANWFRSTGYAITLPYDTWIYGDKKSNLQFIVWYQLPIGTYSGTQCSITIWVMTDEMEQSNTVTYATVKTITSSTVRREYITVSEINDALTALWKDSDWQYIRFKITLNGGNESSWIMQKTPKFFDIKATHNEIKNEIQ